MKKAIIEAMGRYAIMEKVKEELRLSSDLGLDSLDYAEIEIDLNRRLGVMFDEEDDAAIGNNPSIKDVIDYTWKKINDEAGETVKKMSKARRIAVKALDFVCPKDKPHIVGLVTECSPSNGECSIEWLTDYKHEYKNAWWYQDELTKVDSLPALLTREMAHPFGMNKNSDKVFFK